MWGSDHRSCPELAKIGGEDLAFQVNRETLVPYSECYILLIYRLRILFYTRCRALQLKVWEPYYFLMY